MTTDERLDRIKELVDSWSRDLEFNSQSPVPTIEQLRELQEQLGRRIQTGIIEDLMNANTLQEVDSIVIDNSWYFEQWPVLIRFAARARNRIERVNNLKLASWMSQLN